MKEYEYSIIRRVSRNPKRNREGRGISQSDLEALRQELSGDQNATVTAVRDDLELVDIASEEMRNRLELAEGTLAKKLDSGAFAQWHAGDYANRQSSLEEELRKKLDSGAFAQWQAGAYANRQSSLDEELRKKLGSEYFSKWQTGELADALAGKASTVDVQQSARDAIAEAIKRAGEMDKQIKVGGRNLIKNGAEAKRQCGEFAVYRLYKPIEQSEPLTLSFDVIKVEKPPIGGLFFISFFHYSNFRTYASVKYEEGKKRYSVSVQALWYNYNLYEDKKGYDPDYVFIYPNDTYKSSSTPDVGCFTIANVKLERGTIATDWTPAPEDRDEQIKALQKALDDGLENKLGRGEYEKWLEESYKKKKKEAEDKVNDLEKALEDKLGRGEYEKWLKGSYKKYKEDTESSLTNLKNVALTTQQREDLDYLTKSLQVLRSTDNKLEGVALQRHIALSGNGKDITAYLASNSLPAVLKAGITDFGTINEREQVEITHQGTGHLGNLYFTGDQIDFKTGWDANPYLSIGAWDMEPIDRFVKTTRVDDTPVSVYSLELSSKRKVYEQTISVANDGTRLTVHIDKLTCDCVLGSYAQLTLDGHLLTTWRGNVKDNDKGLDSGDFGLVDVPYQGENLSYERVVSAGTHTLRLEVVDKSRGGLALDGLTVRRYYDSGRRQSLLTRNGMRFFASADRYLDVDYRSEVFAGFEYVRGQGKPVPKYVPNPYIVRIKGGMQVDELDMPGVPLCGASFDASGSQVKAFGKYANKRGSSRAQAVYYDSGRFFRVYHSIGHTNYLPTVQVIGDNGNDINWSLAARIYAVNANDFAVRIITNGDNPIRHAFSFVAFKTM